jgi:hypothetical protein
MRLPVRVPMIKRAGGWGLPGPRIRRPASPGVGQYSGLSRTPIRPNEGSGRATVAANGTAVIHLGPDALTTWYVSHCSVKTTTGAADASTAQIVVGPIPSGPGASVDFAAPGGTTYAGGGDTVGLGQQVLRPGDFVSAYWSGAVPGDTATLTLYGQQDILI